MFKAIRGNKIIAVSAINDFKFLVFDEIQEDTTHNVADFVCVGDEFVLTTDEKAQEQAKQAEIARLKDDLADTDYKIIKCSEYNLAGQSLPYNIADLHAKRQALRDRINELEG
jgi:hypothetical protein